MIITRKAVADKIAANLHHEITAAQLVDWAENAMMDGDFANSDAAILSQVLGRIEVSDVRAFGLTWEDCEHLRFCRPRRHTRHEDDLPPLSPYAGPVCQRPFVGAHGRDGRGCVV